MRLFQFLNQGGIILWLIFACSILALFLFLERLLHLRRAAIASPDFLRGIFTVLKRGNIEEAVSNCEDTPGPVAHVTRAAILHYDEDRETITRAVQEAGIAEIPRLERNLNLLLGLAQITPLLGLLGTVLGLMEALAVMQEKSPLIEAADLSGGMWMALLTTAAGLAVAIPTYAAYTLLVGKVQMMVLEMERAASEILHFLMRQQGQPRETQRETAGSTV